jgi:hypothetical protein
MAMPRLTATDRIVTPARATGACQQHVAGARLDCAQLVAVHPGG